MGKWRGYLIKNNVMMKNAGGIGFLFVAYGSAIQEKHINNSTSEIGSQH